MTVEESLALIDSRLQMVDGFERHATDATLLLAAALGVEPSELHQRRTQALSAGAERFLDAYFAQRPLPPVPLHLGYCEVRSLRFAVSHATLLPGTETERMFDVATQVAIATDARLIADAGTGFGKIAIVLALRVPTATVYATDCSQEALAVAERNVAAYGLSHRVICCHGNWLEPLVSHGRCGQLDLIVSNPPYCREGSLSQLSPGFVSFAPRIAINGGPDGLSCHRALILSGLEYLRSGGWLLLQTDDAQACQVADLVVESGGYGPPSVELGSDTTPRFVFAQKLHTNFK